MPGARGGSGASPTPIAVALRLRGWALARLVRLVGIGVMAGVAGGAAAGLASRVAMRISGLLAGPESARLVTFDGFVVGAVTLRGTLLLVALGAISGGVMGGVAYAAFRSWLAPAGRWRGALFGLITLAAFGRAVFDANNFDFTTFGPATVNVPLYATLFLVFGLVAVPAAERLHAWLPDLPARQPRGWAGSGVLLAALGTGAGALVLLGGLATQLATGSAIQRPTDVGPVTAVAVLMAILAVHPLARWLRDRAAGKRMIGYALIAAPVTVGGFLTVREMVAILTG